jgi:hypothetical protein
MTCTLLFLIGDIFSSFLWGCLPDGRRRAACGWQMRALGQQPAILNRNPTYQPAPGARQVENQGRPRANSRRLGIAHFSVGACFQACMSVRKGRPGRYAI